MTPKVRNRELDELLMLTDEINATIEAWQEPSQRIVDTAIGISNDLERDNVK